ncbi:MAG: phosphodiester glycosidase family protein [Chthoniobacteraceae bacterium]
MKFAATVLLLCTTPLFAAPWTLVKSETRPAPAGLAFREARVTDGSTEAVIYQVGFAPKTHAFAVMDNPDGAYDLGSACAKRGALAGVNGGYFQPDRTPLGLVVRQGAQLHPLEKSRLLSGVISVTPNAVAIQRTAAFKPTPAVREALQAGPFLVEGGKKIAGLNVTKGAARTVVYQDAVGRAGFLICKSVSLAEMADILATAANFPEGKIIRALNLDGGSSTALWVRGEPPFYQREWKSVRNYLAIVPR